MFLLDGINNYGSIRDTYAVQPTLDDIQEFKLQSHNDEAQFGQVLGRIVNVVTKVRDQSVSRGCLGISPQRCFRRGKLFQSRKDTAEAKTSSAGSDRRSGHLASITTANTNKTFFYVSYEGFRNHTASNNALS